MRQLGYYNGRFGPLEEMTVPMNDRACFFGDGVYEAAPCANYNIFALKEHVDRIYRSAELVEIPIPMGKEEMTALLGEMSRKVDSPHQLVYWQVTRGTADRVHAFPEEGGPANLWMVIRPAKPVDHSLRRKLITVEDTRFLHCNIKTINLIPNVMAAQRAKEAGCYEAVFHRGDRVTECSHSNISILKDGKLRTHPCNHEILAGISRARLLGVCGRRGIPAVEEPFTLEELAEADEVLVTSSSVLCLLAGEVDGRPVGGRDTETALAIQGEMLEEFRRETEGA